LEFQSLFSDVSLEIILDFLLFFISKTNPLGENQRKYLTKRRLFIFLRKLLYMDLKKTAKQQKLAKWRFWRQTKL